MAQTLMPAAFFGHGNPMNALTDNRYTEIDPVRFNVEQVFARLNPNR